MPRGAAAAVSLPRAAIICRTSREFMAIGFSTSTCLPFFMALTARPRRAPVGIARITASTCLSASSASALG